MPFTESEKSPLTGRAVVSRPKRIAVRGGEKRTGRAIEGPSRATAPTSRFRDHRGVARICVVWTVLASRVSSRKSQRRGLLRQDASSPAPPGSISPTSAGLAWAGNLNTPATAGLTGVPTRIRRVCRLDSPDACAAPPSAFPTPPSRVLPPAHARTRMRRFQQDPVASQQCCLSAQTFPVPLSFWGGDEVCRQVN